MSGLSPLSDEQENDDNGRQTLGESSSHNQHKHGREERAVCVDQEHDSDSAAFTFDELEGGELFNDESHLEGPGSLDGGNQSVDVQPGAIVYRQVDRAVRSQSDSGVLDGVFTEGSDRGVVGGGFTAGARSRIASEPLSQSSSSVGNSLNGRPEFSEGEQSDTCSIPESIFGRFTFFVDLFNPSFY